MVYDPKSAPHLNDYCFKASNSDKSSLNDERENNSPPLNDNDNSENNSPPLNDNDDSENNSPPLNDNDDSENNSPPLNDNDDDGYESQPDMEMWDDGAEAMMNAPVKNVPEFHIREYIRTTGRIKRYPADAEIDPVEDRSCYQEWVDRNTELRNELERRKQNGTIPYSPSAGSYTSTADANSVNENTTQNPNNAHNENTTQNPNNDGDANIEQNPNKGNITDAVQNYSDSGSTSNKRKFESDNESSTQPDKIVKDTSEGNITDSVQNPKPFTIDSILNGPESASTSNKRKFEADNESSTQPAKKTVDQNELKKESPMDYVVGIMETEMPDYSNPED